MWSGTDEPKNLRKGICDYCVKELENKKSKS